MSAVVKLSSRRLLLAEVPTVPLMRDRILRLREVCERVGLSRASIYRGVNRGEFPRSVSLGGRSIGWRESDINAWIASRGAGGAQ